MDTKQEFITLIKDSPLPDPDKKEWETLILASPDSFITDFYEAVKEFPNEIVWFNEIYKKKKKAFAMFEKDKTLAEKILSEIYQEEREKIEKLLTSK